MTRPLHFTPRTENSEVNGRLLHSEITGNSLVGITPDPMEVKPSLPFPDSRFSKALHKRHLWAGLIDIGDPVPNFKELTTFFLKGSIWVESIRG